VAVHVGDACGAWDIPFNRSAIRQPVSAVSTQAMIRPDFRSRSHDAVIRVYDDAGNVLETHEHKGDFKDW